jgi:ABC-2 type transport system permease protein
MSTVTTSRGRWRDAAGVTFPRVLTSEWIKLRSLRSSVWSLVVTVAILIGISTLIALSQVSRWAQVSPAERAHFDPLSVSTDPSFLAQLAVGVLGVLVISGEYTTGMIRSSMTAVPHRTPVLAAKGVVLAAAVLAVSEAAIFADFALSQAILSSKHIQAHLGDPGVARAVAGTGLFLSAIALLGLGLGALLRSTAAGIATLSGLILVLPTLVSALPQAWQDAVDKYLPSVAGQQISTVNTRPHQFGPWGGFGILCLWATVVLAAALTRLRRSDA